MPGNSSSTKAASIEDSSTNACLPLPARLGGSSTIRLSERGARTMARWPGRPNASLPSSTTTTFSDLLRILGNGCEGSRPSGDSTGMTLLRNQARSQRRWRAFQVLRPRMSIPASASCGRSTSFQQRYCASTRPAARSWISSSSCAGAMPSDCAGRPRSMAWRTVAARISKNSSRLVQEMHRKRSRSSSGTCGSWAWARTRKLKSSCDSSRLRYSAGSRRASAAGSWCGASKAVPGGGRSVSIGMGWAVRGLIGPRAGRRAGWSRHHASAGPVRGRNGRRRCCLRRPCCVCTAAPGAGRARA